MSLWTILRLTGEAGIYISERNDKVFKNNIL